MIEFFGTLSLVICIIIPMLAIMWFNDQRRRYLFLLFGFACSILFIILLYNSDGDMGSLVYAMWATMIGAVTVITFIIMIITMQIREKQKDDN